jgi:hypothetical protein
MGLKLPIRGWGVHGDVVIGEFDGNYVPVFNLPNITALIGGAATTLDSIITVGEDGASTGTRVVLRHSASGADLEYVLIDSPGSEVVPWKIRPDDFDGSTNDRGWDLRAVRKDGLICAWDKSDNQRFYRLFSEPDDLGTLMLKPDSANPFTITS